MNRLIKLQLRNIFHSKFFYVCMILTILLSPIASLISEIFVSSAKTEPVMSHIVSFFNTEPDIIILVFFCLLCCMDFNEGTAKNIIARGYTRCEYLFSKYIASLIGVFIIYLVTIGIIFVLFIKNGIGFESDMIYLLIESITYSIAIVIVYGTVSVMLEKNAASIIACIVSPTIISLIITLLDGNLKLNVGKYWISNASSEFLDNPVLANLWFPLAVYAAYIVVSIIIGTNLIKNKEIK